MRSRRSATVSRVQNITIFLHPCPSSPFFYFHSALVILFNKFQDLFSDLNSFSDFENAAILTYESRYEKGHIYSENSRSLNQTTFTKLLKIMGFRLNFL